LFGVSGRGDRKGDGTIDAEIQEGGMLETKDKIDLTLRVGLLASVIMQAYNPSDVLIIKVALRSAKNMMADIEARVAEIERGTKK
jgi:hypothetical protein